MTRADMQRIDALLDGSIARDEFEALQQAMREDPAVLRHYRRQAAIHGQLEWELREAAPAPAAAPAPFWESHRLWFSAAAAIALLVGLTSFLVLRPAPPAAPPVARPAPTPPPSSVARVASLKQAEWASGPMRRNQRLLPGDYRLQAGSATLVLDSGAILALQGPARIQISSAERVLLQSGRATVEIPNQAAGFALETPTASLSDQATRFAVAVGDSGRTEIHVIDGILELVPKFGDLSPMLVRSDRPVSVDPRSIVTAADRPFADFPELPDPGGRPAPGFVHWSFDTAVSESSDHTIFPDLGLKREGGRTFPARVQTRRGASAVALVPGRFGSAVQFNGEGGFVSTSLPGIPGNRARTLAFWVRIPPNAEPEQSYSITSWGTTATGGKWQVGWNHGLDNPGNPGAIRTEVQGGFCIGSTDLRDGRWHHVACVLLGGENAQPGTHIRHYVDGRLEKTTAFRNTPIRTVANSRNSMPVAIGRRLEGDREATFRGVIDEFYLFPEALTPQQIERLHLQNTIQVRRGAR